MTALNPPNPQRSPQVQPSVDRLPTNWLLLAIKALVILGAGLWALSPVLRGTWYGDDDIYLLNNVLLNEPDRIWKAWFVPGSFIEYYPLEQTVQWCQWKLWDLNSPFYYLVTNLVLHLTSALLLWHLFSKMGLKLAWLGGLLFAIYPLMVDSVGVSCELKNTLSLPPFVVAMCFYLDYENRRDAQSYFLALLMFLVAMFCKITMDFFPIIILLYAWWKRGRITWADGKAALPFFIISLVLGATNVYAAVVYLNAIHFHAPGPVHLGGVFSRLALAGLSLTFYFGHAFLPIHPVPFYPMWQLEPLTPLLYLPWLAIGVALIVCWMKRDSWGRPVLFALAFFALGLAPFIGLNEFSYMCLAWVHDHFLYIPIIALIGLVIAGLEGIGQQLPKAYLTPAITILVLLIALAGYQTHSYAKVFSNPEQLWGYNVGQNPNSWIVRFSYGDALAKNKKYEEAIPQVEESLRLNPDFYIAHLALGVDLYSVGNLADAIDAFQGCVKMAPQLQHARYNLAFILLQANRPAEAVDQFSVLAQAHPESAEVHYGFGSALAGVGRIPEGISQLEEALKIDPNNDKYKECLEQIKASAH